MPYRRLAFMTSENQYTAIFITHQWRIQDVPDGGAPTPEIGPKTYYLARF